MEAEARGKERMKHSHLKCWMDGEKKSQPRLKNEGLFKDGEKGPPSWDITQPTIGVLHKIIYLEENPALCK